MIFLGQFLNLEMSSILIMILERFFKLSRGEWEREGGQRRERERAFLFVFGKKGKGFDSSGLNTDDTGPTVCPQ